MTLFREAPAFWPTIEAAAGQRGISAEIVEKDYWVTEALRDLSEQFPDDFVFKGGTNLSKAYRCIEGFSEDVDILVLPADRGRSARERLMKEMVRVVAERLGLARGERNRGAGTHHNEHLIYPSRLSGSRQLPPDVLLEMGIRGEDLPPHEMKVVGSWLGDTLAQAATFDTGAHEDLVPYVVPALHPARTLVEKVLLIHGAITGLANGVALPGRGVARHYYDVYELLGLAEVRAWLDDRTAFEEVVASHEAVSRDCFAIVLPPRPDGGYAKSIAFDEAFREHRRLGEQSSTTR